MPDSDHIKFPKDGIDWLLKQIGFILENAEEELRDIQSRMVIDRSFDSDAGNLEAYREMIPWLQRLRRDIIDQVEPEYAYYTLEIELHCRGPKPPGAFNEAAPEFARAHNAIVDRVKEEIEAQGYRLLGMGYGSKRTNIDESEEQSND